MRVEIHPWSPLWSHRFEVEKALLHQALGPASPGVHHIGSTAVPHLPAKPIIDILLAATDLALLDRFTPALETLGYEALGEFGIPGRRYFRKGGDNRTHHLHAFTAGSDHVRRHLAFRDYLVAHPAERQAYADFKTNLAASCAGDWESYCEGKAPYTSNLETKALAWAASYSAS